MNQMNTMVNSFFSDPFGDVMGMAGMGFPSLMGGHPAMPAMGQLMPHIPRRQQRGRELMPFGFPMDNVFSAIDNRQVPVRNYQLMLNQYLLYMYTVLYILRGVDC